MNVFQHVFLQHLLDLSSYGDQVHFSACGLIEYTSHLLVVIQVYEVEI